MEFEKNFYLLKKVLNLTLTNQVMGVATVIKNGYEFCVSLNFFDEFKFPLLIEIYNKAEKQGSVFYFGSETISTNYISKQDLSICVYKDARLIAFYGNSNLILRKSASSLFDDTNEDIERIIDNEMKLFCISEENEIKVSPHKQNLPQVNKKQLINMVLQKPLFRLTDLKYFKKVEVSLFELFANCERERVLECMFSCSKWVRAQTRKGVIAVGIIYDENKPKYIAIGIHAKTASSKYKDTKLGRMFYYPISLNTKFGYYIIFKSAKDGRPCRLN